ncbi:MAG: ABC transporter ATP-binding protein [Coriobacteriia bacterium]|nr:ABC transporter ATP-binding protein [Coriobacteriia bacterium]
MNIIEMKHLTKYYGKERGIIDVNLAIEQGEVFGFIGPNGAGKSTAIRTLLGLIRPSSGSATIFGKSCIEFPQIKQDLGYLPSEVFYYDDMRVIDLLEYSASFYDKDCSRRIAELADILDLNLKKKIDSLSYGNKKKVGIVQGLLHEPKLIVLDEPTGGLDPLMQQKFFEIIVNENKKGATVFFSSHILSEVQKMCDRVAFIKEGRIIKSEKISDMQDNSYKKIDIKAKTTLSDDLFTLAGIEGLSVHGNSAEFIFRGDINDILRKISPIDLTNLTIEEPDLEEIFLHYYEHGEEPEDGSDGTTEKSE